jgi:uncharacterized secreted repeat protein (TIGR03808 family)
MSLTRRHFLALSAASALSATAVQAAPLFSPLGIDASQLGVRPGSPDDQTRVLQRAIDQAARAEVPLALPPGSYRTGELTLPPGARLTGLRGATRLVLIEGRSLLSAAAADRITLSGLVLDGRGRSLPAGRGLVHLANGQGVRIEHCELVAAGGDGLVLEQVAGEVSGNTITGAADAALRSLDARGLIISGNTVRGAGNNGILVWRSQAGDDGTLVIDNRIESIAARAGGSGQNGNAINVFRAGNVIVRGNRIKSAAFSAVRGNGAANLQVTNNTCTGLGEVALYVEFGFDGAVIANNIIDGAALGIAATNFNHGGRLVVIQGNLVRNLVSRRPAGTDPGDAAGVGIAVEADAAVTGNVVEGAPTAGLALGFGPYLRDVSATGNVVRNSGIGIAVSVALGAGAAVIADNLISGATAGAIVGMAWTRPVTGDLAQDGAGRFAQLSISGNRVR